MTNLLDSFLIRAALAGIGVALAAAPLGCFVVWRRMAYFGDATAHAAILGVALSLALSLSVFAGALAAALIMALTVSALSGRGYAMDTLLGVMAHSALAIGLVAVSFIDGARIDLMAYLFGDILSVSRADLGIIWAWGAGGTSEGPATPGPVGRIRRVVETAPARSARRKKVPWPARRSWGR